MFGLRTLKRDLKVKRDVDTVMGTLQDAADSPVKYRDPSWWEGLLMAGTALVDDMPLPDDGRRAMTNWLLKIGAISGVVVGVAAQLQTLPLPPKAMAVIGSVATVAAAVAALFHAAPGAEPSK